MNSQQRICIIAEGQLGDLLILSPALRAFKESFPSASLTVLVLQRRSYDGSSSPPRSVLSEDSQGGTAAVLRSDPHVGRVAEIDRGALRALGGLRRVRAEWSVIRWLRQGRFDTVVCTFPQDRFYLWAFLSGARVRVGEEGRSFSSLLSHRIRKKKSEGGVLAYYCALAEAAGATVRSQRTSVVISPAHTERAASRWRSLELPEEKPVVAVHPGASGDYRIWPPGNYAALIDHLQRGGTPVILTGSSFDSEVLGEVNRRCGIAPRLVTTSDVLDLAALLQKCALCVSNNSGPRHLAVAAGVRSLALIPRFDDVEWKIYADETEAGTMQSREECPACPPTACLNALPAGERYGSLCMRALTVEEVAARVDILLGVPRSDRRA
ncbi:MAG TPA: glycosyltransferase family 9 protein [Bacteroidota bacterium]